MGGPGRAGGPEGAAELRAGRRPRAACRAVARAPASVGRGAPGGDQGRLRSRAQRRGGGLRGRRQLHGQLHGVDDLAARAGPDVRPGPAGARPRRAAERSSAMTERTYLDFDVLVEPASATTYRARVLKSPVGGTRPVSVTIPFSELELDNFLLPIGRPRR